MTAFIDAHRQDYGVEPICRLLQVAPSAYYERVRKRQDPERRSQRNKRDHARKPEILRVFNQNFGSMASAKSGGKCGGKASRSPAARSSG